MGRWSRQVRTTKEGDWIMRTKKKEETQDTLLKELCGADAKLYAVLSRHLCETPLAAISKKDLDILTEEAEESGNFIPAVDKAIFEGAQNPTERERYIKVIQNLASKTIHATEQEKEKLEKEGLTDRAASLGRRIEHQEFMSERVEDILNVASKFYSEKLVEREENVKREAREQKRIQAEREEKRIGELEETGRDARRKDRRGMRREEKREAKERDKREDLAAAERKAAREEARKEAEGEEKRIGELETTGRDARRKERRGN